MSAIQANDAASNAVVRCAACKHWKKQPPGGSWIKEVIDQGACGRIYEGSHREGAKAETFNHVGDDSGLFTDPDFGCVHGET